MSIGEVKATIREGTKAAQNGKRVFTEAVAGANDAEALARHTLHGTHQKYAEKGLTLLKEAADEVDHTLKRFAEAVEHANAYLKALG
ncbi:hypothetical protein ACWDV4_23930 [Micromonospora sp. NPDC003197]